MNRDVNPFWQQRINLTFQRALQAYPRVLMLRVDLRTPDSPAATDAAVISRFMSALKAKIAARHLRKQHEKKRVHATTLRYIWVREYGACRRKKHYHVVLLLNRDTWCGAGDYQATDSLAGLIKQAWCSALRVDIRQYATLAHFPQHPALWIERGNTTQLQQGLSRANYLAKHYTKVIGDGQRNIGCSQG
ncbi:hypothetical protein A9798_15455 [Edwardsiella hoshinae]|uniref:YagK/YfjJ C-terminal domain-containing protein n=1 Tax=Edwardsiella hoshinae TaxID=93378 RepID=A0ABM6ENP0_9GAMM|nr:inovirus Gp2 family protein [Edwardsiella hoshinae]AOV98667.1 hypothetical protein A9798_15455 [Edwardsiella hoshinae]